MIMLQFILATARYQFTFSFQRNDSGKDEQYSKLSGNRILFTSKAPADNTPTIDTFHQGDLSDYFEKMRYIPNTSAGP